MPDPRSYPPPTARSARAIVARWVLALALLGSAMAFGATHTPVLLCVVPPLAIAAALAWWGAEPMRPRPAATILFWTCLGLTLFTIVQAVPLPLAWVRAVDPSAGDVWARALYPLGEPGPRWVTLSLDPLATRVEVVRGVAYLLAFVAAVRIATRREGAHFLEGALVVTGLALAVAAWVHPALGADKVFGFYSPLRNPGARHIAPILNANVLSGYLNVPLCLAFAQAIHPRSPFPRAIAAAVTAFLLATQLWIASRGGMLGAVFGLGLVVWMSRAPGPGEKARLRGLAVAGIVGVGVAMLVLASSEQAWQELSETDVSKLQIALRALYLVPLYPVFGVGRGAFESAFPAVRDDVGYILYTHPENIVSQWASEWGPLVAALGAAAIVVALRPRSALVRSPRAAGPWAALVCVGAQNLVDFSSEYPGVVLALTVCAALVVGGTGGVDTRRVADAWSKAPRALTLGSLVLGGLVVVLGVTCLGGDVARDRRELHRAALDPSVSREAFHAEERAAMQRHPAEPYLPFAGGLRALRARDESVVPWVEATLERSPVYGPAHLVLARALAARSPAQSRLEYRFSLEQAPELGGVIAEEILRHIHSFDDATEVLVHGRGRGTWLELLAQGLRARLPATSARLDEELQALEPRSSDVALRRAQAALDDLHEGAAAPWCDDDRVRCVEGARALAVNLEKLAPSRCDGFSIRARVELVAGDPTTAVKTLRAATTRVTNRTTCLEELAEVARQAGADATASETLDELTRAGCTDPKDCLSNLLWAASFEQGRGNPHRALTLLQRAHERDPSDEALLGRIAELAASIGLHAEAMRAYEELARRHPGAATDFAAAAAREREALLKDSVKL